MFFVGGVGCEEVASKNMNIANPGEGVLDVDFLVVCVKASYWEGLKCPLRLGAFLQLSGGYNFFFFTFNLGNRPQRTAKQKS